MENKQVHPYLFKNVLRPRGGIAQKESLSLYITDRLKSCFESWTDPKYADSQPEEKVISQLQENLLEEVSIAFILFLQSVEEKENVNSSDRISSS